MSDPVTALNGAENAAGIATVREVGPTGMITLRGSLADKTLQEAAQAASGAKMPEARKITLSETGGLAWMSSDEVLIQCLYAEVHDTIADLNAALGDHHALAVNVSDARAMFEISGPHVRDVLAKLMPIDLRADRFGKGDFRRSRLAQVPAALWMPEANCARIICFRSVARYVFDVLNVAAQTGSEVGRL